MVSTMPNANANNLVLWLRQWREELAAADAGDLPGPLPDDVPAPALAPNVQPFDRFGIWPSDVRLLNPWLVRDVRRPLYFAVLAKWLDGLWLMAPFSRFTLPATVGEWNTGRGEADPRQDPISILSLWNAHTVPPEVVQQSWFIDTLTEAEMANAWEVFRHVTTGKPLTPALRDRVGPPIYHPADPRNDYLAQEAAALRPLGNLAEQYVTRLAQSTSAPPTLVEAEPIDYLLESTIGPVEPALAGEAATKGGGATMKLRVLELAVRVTIRRDPNGDRAVAKVTSLEDHGPLSNKLDGGAIMKDGQVIGKFSRGRAVLPAAALSGRIGLRNRKGQPLRVELEPPA